MARKNDLRPVGPAAEGPGHDELLEVLRGVVDPELGENIVELEMVRSIGVEGSRVVVEVALTIAGCPLRNQLRDDVTARLSAVPGVEKVEVVTSVMDREARARVMSIARRAAQRQEAPAAVPSGARVLGVVSGKGGVGKSSVTVNLATALAAEGLAVGILDADIWGFSVPRMLDVSGPLEVRDQKMVPIRLQVGAGRLEVVSMGFLADEDEAIMWRGLVLARAVQHFLEDVAWSEDLDYLLVDMPPGTGDVQMALARMLPRLEVLVVTTPALGAQKVAGRAADMARRANVRVVGVVENMSAFVSDDGRRHLVFGEGGGQRLADELEVALLGSIPIDPAVTAGGDSGRPVARGEGPAGEALRALARRVRASGTERTEMAGCSARLVAHVEEALSARPAS